MGGPVEKTPSDIFYNMKQPRQVSLNEMQIDHIKNVKNVIVYGAAFIVADIIDILGEKGINISLIAVSSMKYNPAIFCDISVDTIENISGYMQNDVVIVIGVSKLNSEDVKQ